MKRPLSPPPIRQTIPPGVVPGERRLTWEALLGKPDSLTDAGMALTLADIPGQVTTTREFLRSQGTGTVAGTPAWDTLLPADVTGDVAATRKFLRSLGTGVVAGVTVWDTFTAADVGTGTFPAGTFTFPSAVVIGAHTGQASFAMDSNGTAGNGPAWTLKINGASIAQIGLARGLHASTSNVLEFASVTGDGFLFGNSPLGFYGVTPTARQTVTGSRGGNAAVASALTALATLGLIIDGSSA